MDDAAVGLEIFLPRAYNPNGGGGGGSSTIPITNIFMGHGRAARRPTEPRIQQVAPFFSFKLLKIFIIDNEEKDNPGVGGWKQSNYVWHSTFFLIECSDNNEGWWLLLQQL